MFVESCVVKSLTIWQLVITTQNHNVHQYSGAQFFFTFTLTYTERIKRYMYVLMYIWLCLTVKKRMWKAKLYFKWHFEMCSKNTHSNWYNVKIGLCVYVFGLCKCKRKQVAVYECKFKYQIICIRMKNPCKPWQIRMSNILSSETKLSSTQWE